jgi:hypothetical protein
MERFDVAMVVRAYAGEAQLLLLGCTRFAAGEKAHLVRE